MAATRHALPHRPSIFGEHTTGTLAWVWAHPAASIGTAALLAVTSGLSVALVMPRGPLDTGHALLLMAIGIVTGVASGLVMRSRWAMLLTPVIHYAAFELGRIGESGPTVDMPNFDTTFGILALIVSRGVYVVIGLFPMAVGAIWGATLARRLVSETRHTPHRRAFAHYARRAGGALSTAMVVALAIWIAMPASVAPVTGPDGQPIEGSIAELTKVSIGGNDQWLEIRGASEDLPVLLYVSGGPGQSDLALSRALLDDLTQDFIVVGWDQRGNGKSYAAWNGPSITLDRVVTDMIDVTNYLRDRFGEEKIYVLGESWGTTLAVLAAQRAPELYHALIGSGQMVSQRETDRIIYDDLLAWAETHGDTGLAGKLHGFGPPPYRDVWAYGYVLTQYEKIEGAYDPPQAYTDRGESSGVGFWGVMGSEYTAIDKANVFRGLVDTFDVLYPQLQEIDFRQDVPSLDVPIYLFDGEHELRGRRDLAHEWLAMLDAPTKEIYIFENAGHAVAFEHADDLHRILVEEILPATYPGG